MVLRVVLLLAALCVGAFADKHDGLTELVRPPPGPPAPSCNKVNGCYGHGVCTPTLPGGTCKCNKGFAPSPPAGKKKTQRLCDSPTAALLALEKKYNTTRDAVCATVLPKVPTLDATAAATFMTAYKGFMGNTSEAPVLAAAAKLMADPKLTAFLALPDSFSSSDGLDAAMVKCAVMREAYRGLGASSRGVDQRSMLAVFAVQSAANAALVEKLLGDTVLMKDMLVAGGQIDGMYGEAMAIYSKLLKSSSGLRAAVAASAAAATPWDDRTAANVLKRLAVGTALAHAMPVAIRFSHAKPAAIVDPVARYAHFEAAYKAGALDPAFPVLTTFELSHTVDVDSQDEDMTWLRTSMMNFRPDDIAIGYHWRYAESVHSDVAYGDSHCNLFNNGTGGVCHGHFSDIPVGGDVCGGRAFWGRFACKGFGRPTWGATEHAHAAMSAWTPSGWTVLLGAPWPDCWWGPRGGEDFVLETQARENQPAFQKVLRGSWVALAKDEQPVNGMWHESAKGEARTTAAANGQGGLWSALMLYFKKSVAKITPPANRTIPTVAGNKVQQLVAKWAQPPAPPAPIATGADGTITIPAASFTSKNKTSPISVMKSADAGSQLLSNGCTSSVGPPCFFPASSSWTYDVTAAAAGSFFLTANFSTWHMNQDLNVTVNGAKSAEVPMFYNLGFWNETQPIEVTLTKGKNTVVFTRTSTRDVMYKTFSLYPKKPVVPKPPGNYTPTPPPPTPSASDYVEVAADTTCIKQGIQPVTEKDCGHACLALGLKSTGPRARPTVMGCFAMTTGPYAGNCNFNTNKSASCVPEAGHPCELYGVVTRALCTRK